MPCMLKILPDIEAENPRNSYNIGTIFCWHSRYNLGDAHNFAYPIDFTPNIKKLIILPVYIYDQAQIALNTTGFSCKFDSGQVGWIFVSKDIVRKEWEVKRITKKIRQQVVDTLSAEVEKYTIFLRGGVCDYVIKNDRGDELDSAWGFYNESFCRHAGAMALASFNENEGKNHANI